LLHQLVFSASYGFFFPNQLFFLSIILYHFVSSDAECCCLKPVHSVIVESRQT